MTKLNLAYPELSDIPFKIQKFPDGQQNVAIGGSLKKDDVIIVTRLRNFCDIEILICAVARLRKLGIERIALHVPYFLGARSDREFVGVVNYLKEVICPIINGLEFTSVEVLNPHSDVLEACLDNFSSQAYRLIESSIYSGIIEQATSDTKRKPVLVSPDAGAYKRVEKIVYSRDDTAGLLLLFV